MAKPSKCISVAEARALQSNWMATRAADIQKVQGINDTRDFTFSVNDLQEFLDYVQQESSKQGIANPGIRIYFGAYGEASGGKATVFLAATDGTDGDSGNNYDIDPLNRGINGWPPNAY
ncbi:MAG: hypothetical protein R2773_05090 [Flavobacteriaceae bacterium]